ncbi:ribonuclease E inhibitor RraB [Rubrivivax rivuli]|uniref:Ribonuclease E inhibitor RraB n=1 Tax=Rubrivivax rivuli TaxID=1862385 RepID=A0A437RJW2_9BURK|nr:ribonuclease E inhibitor RraB [Rubrivivax rivuli]RVU47066.1 ribonuclease E inhibitor RraB [Rubrivivax rivuli]
MNPLIEGAIGGALIGLALLPIIYLSIRGRGENTEDHAKLTALSGRGINLERARRVQFVLFVRTEASADYLSSRLTTEGYSVQCEPGEIEIYYKRDEPASLEEGRFLVACKVVVLYGNTLGRIRTRLSALAAQENGYYLGWQAQDLSP